MLLTQKSEGYSRLYDVGKNSVKTSNRLVFTSYENASTGIFQNPRVLYCYSDKERGAGTPRSI